MTPRRPSVSRTAALRDLSGGGTRSPSGRGRRRNGLFLRTGYDPERPANPRCTPHLQRLRCDRQTRSLHPPDCVVRRRAEVRPHHQSILPCSIRFCRQTRIRPHRLSTAPSLLVAGGTPMGRCSLGSLQMTVSAACIANNIVKVVPPPRAAPRDCEQRVFKETPFFECYVEGI